MDQLSELLCFECHQRQLVAISPEQAQCFVCGLEYSSSDLRIAAQNLRTVQLKTLTRRPPQKKRKRADDTAIEIVDDFFDCCGSNFDIGDKLALLKAGEADSADEQQIITAPITFSMKEFRQPFSESSSTTSCISNNGHSIRHVNNRASKRPRKKSNDCPISGGDYHIGNSGSVPGCTHSIESVCAEVSVVKCSICGCYKRCDHGEKIVINSDYAGVCVSCGMVVADGVALFELGCLPGAPFHNRRGSYKIIYYWNEKLAQWSRRCPMPPESILRAFLEEAKNVASRIHPSKFSRKTIARICRTIGSPTTQEKWLMMFDILAKTPGFEAVPKFPIPSGHLLSKIQDCFRIVLPVWFQCKDIEISNDDVAFYIKHHSDQIKHTDMNKLLKSSLTLTKKKRRKSFPHNFMIHQFLKQLQSIFQDDPHLQTCYDLHHHCHKHISDSVHFYQSMIWKHICESINSSAGENGIDFTLSLPFSACSGTAI